MSRAPDAVAVAVDRLAILYGIAAACQARPKHFGFYVTATAERIKRERGEHLTNMVVDGLDPIDALAYLDVSAYWAHVALERAASVSS